MSKKIYLSGGLILVEEAGQNTETFNINSTDFTLSGNDISLVDNITKQAENLGSYTGLTDVNDASFASLALASTYIENLFRPITVIADPEGDTMGINALNQAEISLEGYGAAIKSDPLPVRDPLLEISRDNVTDEASDNKFGRNIEIDSSVTADVWDGGHTVASGGTSLIWLAPTAARIHTIASTSANDTTSGTGANSVRINYLPDWDTAEATETVTGDLNAGIAMINPAVMINRMEVIIQSTSTIVNDGEITATAVVDATVTARIRAGQGQTQMAIYGVPSTQKLRIGRLYGNVNKAGGAVGLLDLTLLANTSPDTNTIPFITKHTFGLQTVGTSAFSIPYYIPKKISGPAIVKIQAASNTNDMDVSAGIDFAIINN